MYRLGSKRTTESRKMRLQPHRSAFSLIELFFVIAVIALLMCLLMPVLANGKIYARNAMDRLVCVELAPVESEHNDVFFRHQ